MKNIDRLEFPKKYPISNSIKFGVLLFIVLGVLIHNCTQNQLSHEVTISDIKITDYSTALVEVQYVLTNQTKVDRYVWLLVKVYDDQGKELESALFQVNARAATIQPMLKIMDKLSRPLQKDEKPAKATIELYKRKVI
jgi:hypothetical protein